MSKDAIEVQISGSLREFVESQTSPSGGLFETADEYIRDLVRRDFERQDERRWQNLKDVLNEALSATDDEFEPLDMQKLMAESRDELNHAD